jgi:molybdenum cofactor cytidylyltransferase
VALASRIVRLRVVVGNRAEDVTKALSGLDVDVVHNPDYRAGQSTSLRAGLASFPDSLAGALVLLVDQPFVDAALIDRLIATFEETGAAIVAPSFAGRRGNPVVFARSLLPALLEVVGDTGARDVIARHRKDLVTVELADDRAFADVDTWEDYERIKATSA